MVDARFAAPPEDFEDLPVQVNGKGKGKEEQPKEKSRKRKAVRADDEEADLYDEVLNGPLPSASTSRLDVKDDHEQQDDDDEPAGDVDDADEPLNLIPKVLQLDNLASYNSKVDRTGIIYLSRIPPGMGPSKVKHILSSYGDVGRIYLVAADPSSSKSSNHTKHKQHRFVEGWVEFQDKRVARHTADLLNARPIGDVATSRNSKKNGGTKKWKDDVWTMKYLPKFKWNNLSEQVAVEAATRAALLRNQIAQSKKEQAEYLRQVERAKNHEKAQDKKRARLERRAEAGELPDTAANVGGQKKEKKGREFGQRTAVTKNTGGKVDEKLGKVLDSLF